MNRQYLPSGPSYAVGMADVSVDLIDAALRRTQGEIDLAAHVIIKTLGFYGMSGASSGNRHQRRIAMARSRCILPGFQLNQWVRAHPRESDKR